MIGVILDDHIERYLTRIADQMVGLKPHTTVNLEMILNYIIIEEAKRRGVTDEYFMEESK